MPRDELGLEGYLERRLAGVAEPWEEFAARLAPSARREVRARVEALLRTGLLDRPAACAPRRERPPELAGYEWSERLGHGGSGEVWRARQTALGRSVAIKLLHPWAADSEPSRARLARFEREARVLAGTRHPGVVRVFEHGLLGERPYLVMELVEGRNLSDFELPPGTSERERQRAIVRLGLQVADALEELHGQGVVHRDVKPANIVLDQRGAPVLVDLGLASEESGEGPTRTRDFVGTPSYAAPEQLHGATRDRRVDVYGLCATLYRLIAGVPPVAGDNLATIAHEHATRGPRPVRSHNRRVDRALAAILGKGLGADPRDRYGSCADLASDLWAWLHGGRVYAQRARPLSTALRWARRHPSRAAALALALGVVLLGALLGRVFVREVRAAEQRRYDERLLRFEVLWRADDAAGAAAEIAHLRELRPDDSEAAFQWTRCVLKASGNYDPGRVLRDGTLLAEFSERLDSAAPLLEGEPALAVLRELRASLRRGERPHASMLEAIEARAPRSADEFRRLHDARTYFAAPEGEQRALLQRALADHPGNLRLLDRLARTREFAGKRATLEAAVACRTLAPARADYRALLAFTWFRFLKANDAESLLREQPAILAELETALREAPDHPTVVFDAAFVFHESGDLDRAEALYRHALEIGPSPQARVNLANLLRHRASESGDRDERARFLLGEHLELLEQNEDYCAPRLNYWKERGWAVGKLRGSRAAFELFEYSLQQCTAEELADLHAYAAVYASDLRSDEPFAAHARRHLRAMLALPPTTDDVVEAVALEAAAAVGGPSLASEVAAWSAARR